MDILSRQVARWQRQQKRSDLPDEVYQFISEDTSSKHRRVVTNLARVSRVIDDEGQIRPYNEFKHDWSFEQATIGEPSECYLCGTHPIIEHCILVDTATDRRITVGNVCVDSFMHITDDEKKLRKTQIRDFKTDQKVADFAMRYPNAMGDLKRYEEMMKQDSELKILHKTMVRRLTNQGFPGAKTLKKWESFIADAEQTFAGWEKREAELEAKRQARMDEQAAREAAFIQEITNRRNKWSREAKEWVELAHSLPLNNWEQTMVQRVATKIKVSGIESLKDGHLAFFESIHIRYQIAQPDFSCEDPRFNEIFSWLDLELSDWDRSFCISVLIRIVAGQELTKKQESVLISLRKRLGE